MGTSARDAAGPFPMAPSADEWAAMGPAERAAVVEALPASMTDSEASPPEGDAHLDAKIDARETLREWFRRLGRSVYVASELTVYYPAEPRFAPDVFAVRDVEVKERTKWVVSAEGKGLEWVLEVHVGGDRKKDAETNVARYARLGIPEYFVYDRARQRLTGYRLPARSTSYAPIVPQMGRYASEVLDLELQLEGGRLRFYRANAELLTPRDLAEKLGHLVEEIAAERDVEAERARTEAERARTEAERARTEAERADSAEAELARLRAELDKLRGR
jgi:Uma2 family endonuclease